VSAATRGIGWPGVVRLSLVQVAIGSVVVLMTSTLNRVMVIELQLAAAVPGALVALHFAMQLLRPRMGFGSDLGGRRIPWIVGGMLLLAVSAVGAAAATAWIATSPVLGLMAAVLAFASLGLGVSASSTPFLAYLAESVPEERMAGAAAVAWIMMIMGIIATAGIAGTLLDPFSPARMVGVCAGVAAVAVLLTLLAVAGRSETSVYQRRLHGSEEPRASFRDTLSAMWAEPAARSFAIFIFVSMLAYSAQDIILEPFAGSVFGMTPGESTRIAGLQHAGVLVGMLVGAGACARSWTLRGWSAAGCIGSAVALLFLVMVPGTGSVTALKGGVFALGLANGLFAVSAIGAMMGLTVRGRAGGAGLRMGFWGAAQAMAYGAGGFLGAGASDVAQHLLGSPALGYATVFTGEALLFVAAAVLVLAGSESPTARPSTLPRTAGRAMVTGD